MADIEIEINGQKLAAKPHQTVIQVADEAGIYIPRFCYHKHLSIPANCRMCLVEVEKAPKPLPACATPVMPGMKIFTQSQKTLAAQRAVMEFLLINHPLDCPICDQGGECELQDLSMGYGSSWSHYDECKKSVADQNLGPLIATEMTRCIACTRCVRFGDEIAGMRELGAIYRGEWTEISTYIQHAIKSEVSGNIIDICPVGALTSKPYRFTARAWELEQAPSISPHDCIGSNLYIHTRYGKVMRVVSRENKTLNETWIADRDRFSYTGLDHVDRLEEPMIKENGQWQVVDWQKAFEVAAFGLTETIHQYGADKFAGLASSSATLEEFYLLQKIVRGLGSPHIDHRLRERDTEDQAFLGAYPGVDISLSELQTCDAILLIGSHLQKEQPLAALRVRKAAEKGAFVLAINPVDYRFNFKTQAKAIVAPQHMIASLEALLSALKGEAEINQEEIAAIAKILQQKQKSCLLIGALAQHHPHASRIRFLAKRIAEETNSALGILTEGANSAGAWLAGAVPHRHAGGMAINHIGFNAYAMFEKPRKAYLFLNVEPEFDCANAHIAVEALKQAKWVIALSTYRNKSLEEHAHVILPTAPFTETSGTFVNAWGHWQSFTGVATAFGRSRPAWKILRVLGNFLQLEGFGFESSEEVKHEVKAIIDNMPAMVHERAEFAYPPSTEKVGLMRIGEIPIYATDGLVRRANPLQATQLIMEGDVNELRIHPETASQWQIEEGAAVRVKQKGSTAEFSVKLDTQIAKQAVWIAGGTVKSSSLGDLFGEVVIEKV